MLDGCRTAYPEAGWALPVAEVVRLLVPNSHEFGYGQFHSATEYLSDPQQIGLSMPIEFHCQSCSRLMRTPDSAAGKKGKCPHCGAMMDIPSSPGQQAIAPASRTRGSDAETAGTKAQGGNADERIEFPCPRCKQPVRTPASTAGKKGKCPSCGEVVQIPAEAASGSKTEHKPSGKIQFRCPGCQKTLRTPADVAGKKIRCPSCSAVLSIPSSSRQKGRTEAAPSPAPVPDDSIGLAPLDDAPGLAPLDDAPGVIRLDKAPGLAPLDDAPGLAPLEDAPGLMPVDESPGLMPVDESPALTPLDDVPSLTPLEEPPSLEPLGDATGLVPLEQQPTLTPIADDPLASAAAHQGNTGAMSPSSSGLEPNPFGDDFGSPGGMAVDPYQSPTLAPAGHTVAPARPFNEAIVVAPAIAMMVVLGINCLVTIPYVIFNAAAVANVARMGQGGGEEAIVAGYFVARIAVCIVLMAIYGIMMFGAWKMLKMQSYGLAMTTAVLMMMPCTFCWIGLPFGIWALVVLCLQDVRQAFA